MSYKNIFANTLLLVVAVSLFCSVGEFIARTFWKSGYRHKYDWRHRTEGYSFGKADGTFRILVLGDSNAYGQGVGRDETFSKLLENYLNEVDTTKSIRKFEVINLAWPGLNTAQEYLEFVNRGLKYNPDMVLVAYCLNDLGEYINYKTDPRAPFYIRRLSNKGKWALPIPKPIDEFLTLRSDLYLFVLSRYNSMLHKVWIRKSVEPDEGLLKAYLEKANDWQFMRLSLGKIYELCQEKKIIPALIVLPYFYELESYRLGEIHKQVTLEANSIGYHVLDLLPSFIGKKSEEYIVSRVDTHPNSLAHKVMAQNIFRFIVDYKFITRGYARLGH